MNSSVLRPPQGQAPVAACPHSEEDVRLTRTWSRFYRKRGLNPLPTRPGSKRPLIRYAEYWEKPFPAAEFERFSTGSMQIMTGRRWGLVVVDLDGPEAIAHWPAMGRSPSRTWITHSGGAGQHWWFSVPLDGPPIHSGRVWGVWEPEANDGRGDWMRHVAVEIVADRKLIMAPPSLHPNGRRYRFLAGHSPEDVARPAPLPAWVMALPRLAAPRPEPRPVAAYVEKAPVSPVAGRFDRNDVLGRIADKVALARSWGLSFASDRPNASGWCSVHAIGREDRNPSASFHAESGRYWEPSQPSMSLFDLGVTLGRYRDWREAVSDLGHRFHARPLGS